MTNEFEGINRDNPIAAIINRLLSIKLDDKLEVARALKEEAGILLNTFDSVMGRPYQGSSTDEEFIPTSIQSDQTEVNVGPYVLTKSVDGKSFILNIGYSSGLADDHSEAPDKRFVIHIRYSQNNHSVRARAITREK